MVIPALPASRARYICIPKPGFNLTGSFILNYLPQLIVTVDRLNKRQAIPVTLADKSGIIGSVNKGFSFEGEEETAVPNIALGKWYKDRDGYYYWGGGLTIIQPEAGAATPAPPLAAGQPPVSNLDLPVNHLQCIKCADWINTHFGEKVNNSVNGTPFEKEVLYAIACQETAIEWQAWINDHTPDEVLARCVFDASGDVNGTRSAFPKNTAAFIARYGQQVADILIAEANATRAMKGWGPKQWVYAGYGIFQYDLQNILTDEVFFTRKMWYSMDNCVSRVMKELNDKWALHPGDLFNTVKAYNGSGPRAESYARNVFQFLTWIKAAS